VAAARHRVATARVVVVATPVYKASCTGLLKAFLDGYGPDALADVGPLLDAWLARWAATLGRAVPAPLPYGG
jgi:FMN reductase